MQISTYIAFAAMVGYFISPVEKLMGLQGTLQNSFVAANRLTDIMDAVNIEADEETRDFICENNIVISNVTFRYGNYESILENFNCSIPIGKHTALVGQNGTGKSTISKLIAGIYTCESGSVKFDDINIICFDITQIKNSIIYLTQNPHFFTDTFKNNICFGSENVSDEELQKVCDIADVSSLISRYPQALETQLDEQGRNLSTGQRQKLALARALLKKPKILILDEATSNIDKEAEKKIYDAIRKNFVDMTIISVTHEINSEMKIDCIIKI